MKNSFPACLQGQPAGGEPNNAKHTKQGSKQGWTCVLRVFLLFRLTVYVVCLPPSSHVYSTSIFMCVLCPHFFPGVIYSHGDRVTLFVWFGWRPVLQTLTLWAKLRNVYHCLLLSDDLFCPLSFVHEDMWQQSLNLPLLAIDFRFLCSLFLYSVGMFSSDIIFLHSR